MKQPKTLESKTFHTFPEMGGGTFVKHLELDLPGMALRPHEGISIMETYMFIPLILSLSDDTGAGWRLGWSNS